MTILPSPEPISSRVGFDLTVSLPLNADICQLCVGGRYKWQTDPPESWQYKGDTDGCYGNTSTTHYTGNDQTCSLGWQTSGVLSKLCLQICAILANVAVFVIHYVDTTSIIGNNFPHLDCTFFFNISLHGVHNFTTLNHFFIIKFRFVTFF